MFVRGGRGGDGVSCFYSEFRKEFGGFDGGDGGNGGYVILRGTCSGKMVVFICFWGRKFLFFYFNGNLNLKIDVWKLFLLNYVDVYV